MPDPVSAQKSPFDEFMLAEYQHIAQAHFNTLNTISEFVKQYVLIVSLPLSLAVVFLKPSDLKSSGIAEFMKQHPVLPLGLAIAIVAAGLAVLGYVINLRLDAVLYARTVNGVREYFYKKRLDRTLLASKDEYSVRVLPRSTEKPDFIEMRHFFFVVLSFAIVGTGYLLVGGYYYWTVTGRSFGIGYWSAACGCLLAHVALYLILASRGSAAYMRARAAGRAQAEEEAAAASTDAKPDAVTADAPPAVKAGG